MVRCGSARGVLDRRTAALAASRPCGLLKRGPHRLVVVGIELIPIAVGIRKVERAGQLVVGDLVHRHAVAKAVGETEVIKLIPEAQEALGIDREAGLIWPIGG